MKNNQLLKTFFFFTFTILTFLFFFLSSPNPAYAKACTRGTLGFHSKPENGGPNPAAQWTGNTCGSNGQVGDPGYNPIADGAYSTVIGCNGGTGPRYISTYCDSGCEETYPDSTVTNGPPGCIVPDTLSQSDIAKVFGKITPPQQLINFGFGATGISKLLSNIIQLIYIMAVIVLIFMIIWGAWDWMTSEGDKEKLSSAQKKLINAFIGIILFAVAFAIIQVLGTFTGFQFFAGQKP